jgi:hypothetical protein
MVLALINTVFAQDTQEAAITQWRAVADQLREKFSKLAVLMDEGKIRCAGLHELPEGTSRSDPLYESIGQVPYRGDTHRGPTWLFFAVTGDGESADVAISLEQLPILAEGRRALYNLSEVLPV